VAIVRVARNAADASRFTHKGTPAKSAVKAAGDGRCSDDAIVVMHLVHDCIDLVGFDTQDVFAGGSA